MTSMLLLTERCSEKHAKKLIGRIDLEEAMKRLDKLTHEQAQMATAEVQRATAAIDESLSGITEQVVAVNDSATIVDDKVAEVINGEQIIMHYQSSITTV